MGDGIEQQDAIEWAIYSKWIDLTYDLETDKETIKQQLPDITREFRRIARENMDLNAPLQELIGSISD